MSYFPLFLPTTKMELLVGRINLTTTLTKCTFDVTAKFDTHAKITKAKIKFKFVEK